MPGSSRPRIFALIETAVLVVLQATTTHSVNISISPPAGEAVTSTVLQSLGPLSSYTNWAKALVVLQDRCNEDSPLSPEWNFMSYGKLKMTAHEGHPLFRKRCKKAGESLATSLPMNPGNLCMLSAPARSFAAEQAGTDVPNSCQSLTAARSIAACELLEIQCNA